jgi:endonuclease-3
VPKAKNQRAKLRRVLSRLRRAYGRREWRSSGRAVEVLVRTLLSQNTTDTNSHEGYRRLRRRFRSWTAAADAPVRAIERCIRPCGLSRRKAPRIRRILRRIRDERGRISLEFLRRRPVDEARDYLLAFDGVGLKTALCVLLFAFGMPVLPVDTHVRRVAGRLGLVPPRTTADKTSELLTPQVAPQHRYELHVLLIAHGRQRCRAANPQCGGCPLLAMCPHGRQRTD